jgi:hypothetical protein
MTGKLEYQAEEEQQKRRKTPKPVKHIMQMDEIIKELLCFFFHFENTLISYCCGVCETWSLTLGEEHRLRVFENEFFYNLYFSPNAVR